MTSYSIGQKIELNDGRTARIQFIGNTSFQTGEWIGVELEEQTGKNDGSVKGERYFNCKDGYGMFLRSAGVRQVLEDVPKPAAKKLSNGAAVKPRPSSLHAGVNGIKKDVAVNKRTSMLASTPTPASRATRMSVSGIRSPVKSPTKQLGSNGVSSTLTSRTSTPPVNTARKPATTATRPRTSVAGTGAVGRSTQPATAAARSRTSLAPASRPPTTQPRTAPTQRPPTRQPLKKTIEVDEDQEDETASRDNASESKSEVESEQEDGEGTPRNFAPPQPPSEPPDPVPRASISRRGSSPPASIHSQRTIRSTAVSSRHVEELEAKIRLLERKRLEDRDAKRSLEQAQQDRDKYQGIIEKLQKKYQPQQQEIVDLKKALAEAEAKFTSIEDLQAEHDTIVEMATLDREMAEETAEALKAELDALRSRQEEMELELEVLREENTEFGKEMSPEERTSAGWLQMEKENDRLRNALLRLRDLTQDREEELKADLKEVQSQVKDFEKFKSELDETKEKLLASESNAEDLRQQLDAALGAEEMIEELTDRNMGLTERIDELRGTIEDLENLKELNDELEINHIEAEKQMQEEIDFKDALVLDRDRVAKQQQAALDDADYTINRFRELVSQLQNDLQDMQASKQISETEAADLENKSRAMIDLNMRLQTSASKTQIKTIDLELRKMEAEEASEHLAIVQLFLPDTFHTERDSVLALLRFKRIAYKATLLLSFIKERISSSASRPRDEHMFAAVDVMNHLTWVASMAERFINAVSTSTVANFTQFEGALYELEPVERALNGYVDALRRDDLKEITMAEELQRSIAVMTHLAGIHMQDELADHADALNARITCLQSQLEGVATGFSLMRSLIEANSQGNDYGDEAKSDMQLMSGRAETLATHSRSAKVIVGKAQRALSELQDRSLTLEPSCVEGLAAIEAVAVTISAYIRAAGEALQGTIFAEGRTELVDADEISQSIMTAGTISLKLPQQEAGPFTAVANEIRTLSDLLVEFAALPNDLDNSVEFERGPAPWVARSEELKRHKLNAKDTEAELARTVESLRERDIVVRSKEAELEEQSVRIEMLEARMREASKRSARIAELERAVQAAKDNERKAKQDLEKSRREAHSELERVRDELGRAAQRGDGKGAPAAIDGDAMGPGAKLTMKKQEHHITTLQSAVRFLKDENTRLRLPTADAPKNISRSLAWLHEPLLKPLSERQKAHAALQKKSKDVLSSLLVLATTSKPIDLTALPDNKLAWRPAKQSSRWQIEKSKEQWETWQAWSDDLIHDVAMSKRMSRKEVTLVPEVAEHQQNGSHKHSRLLSININVPGALPIA